MQIPFAGFRRLGGDAMTQAVRRLGTLTAVLAATLLTACGDGGGGASTTGANVPPVLTSGHFLYVGADSSSVYAYSVDAASGALTGITGSPFNVQGSAYALNFDPQRRFVYFASLFANQLYGFYINQTGGLTALAGSPFATAAGQVPVGAFFDPAGTFAVVPNISSCAHMYGTCSYGNVSSFLFNETTGALAPTTGSAIQIDGNLAFEPKGRFAYAVSNNYAGLAGFQIDRSSDTLVPIAGAPFPSTGGAIAFTPDGRFAYLLNYSSDTISQFSIDQSTGALVAATGSPIVTGTGPNAAIVDSSGRFLYVANPGSNNISAYAINASTGSLSAVPGSPFAAGNNVAGVAIDASNKFLYAPNGNDNTISGFSIDPSTGALTPIAGSPFRTGMSPASIATI
jgi:6-phosphogluconolactonase (cycloisomerase 2 family)